MKDLLKTITVFILSASAISANAQKKTFDILSYDPPTGWTEEIRERVALYTTSNETTKEWMLIAVGQSVGSKGGGALDLESEWKRLVAANYDTKNVQSLPPANAGGWDIMSRTASITVEKAPALVILAVLSGQGKAVSIMAECNGSSFIDAYSRFIASVTIETQGIKEIPAPVPPIGQAPTKDGFMYTQTSFNDGWTSNVLPDWVEATKGTHKVLVHYPRKEEEQYFSQQAEQTKIFWDLLVAPHYNSLSNFDLLTYNRDNEPALMAAGNMTDANGAHYVTLFKKGKGPWMEFIEPDKSSFEATYGVRLDQAKADANYDNWAPLASLSGLNKFAVAISDLQGKWTDHFSGTLEYANVYTGLTTTVSTYASTESWTFNGNGGYTWHVAGGHTVNGVTNAQQATSSGNITAVDNWTLTMSDIEGKPHTYDVHFSAVKGGRLLWMKDRSYGGYNVYGRVK